MKTPGYMDYKQYKKEKNSSAQNVFVVFVTSFLVLLVFFTMLVKHLTPEVDVSIGNDTDVEPKETGLGFKGFIDDRLKFIQMEDQNLAKRPVVVEEHLKSQEDDEDSIFSPEFDEKIKLPSFTKDAKSIATQAKKEIDLDKPSTSAPTPAPTSYTPTLKVVVGQYSTLEQAKVSQSILQDTDLGLAPFIKNMGSYYTLQVGSFTSREKADILTNQLLNNNFPARTIQE